MDKNGGLPSGKLLHSYGKITMLNGKTHHKGVIFHNYISHYRHYQRLNFDISAINQPGWWFGTFFLLSHILGIIILIDQYFSEGLNPPTRPLLFSTLTFFFMQCKHVLSGNLTYRSFWTLPSKREGSPSKNRDFPLWFVCLPDGINHWIRLVMFTSSHSLASVLSHLLSMVLGFI